MSSLGYIEVVPKPVITTKYLVGFRIDNIQVTLFSGAIIRVVLFDAPNSISEIKDIALSKEEYDGWSTDDNYIVDLICQKLEFSKV